MRTNWMMAALFVGVFALNGCEADASEPQSTSAAPLPADAGKEAATPFAATLTTPDEDEAIDYGGCPGCPER